MTASNRHRLWTPTPEMTANSELHRFRAWTTGMHNIEQDDYVSLHAWSVLHLDDFWESVWSYFDVVGHRGPGPVRTGSSISDTEWFPGAKLNYAENILRFADSSPAKEALVGLDETGRRRSWTWAQLRGQVGAAAAWLRRIGVRPGDRVCAVLPNSPEAIIALLATASIGALWSVVNPDFGVPGIRERFSQIEPRVLITGDGYHYNGSYRDSIPVLPQLLESLPTVEHHVLVDRHAGVPDLKKHLSIPTTSWNDIVADEKEPTFERVDFSHDLWILYSSGTTGAPKGIVHSHGGITLEMLKANGLQFDVGADDRVYFPAATTWVMWNLAVNTLSRGATVVTYDGSPTYPDAAQTLRLCASEHVSVLGAGAALFSLLERSGATEFLKADLSEIRFLFSSGSPLPDSTWAWLYANINPDMRLGSDSGGTDVCTGIIGSNPFCPVYQGELMAPYLGVAADIVDENGHSIEGEFGELVVREPMPSMPVRFWADDDGSRLHDAYFADIPGMWRQGDWATKIPGGGFVIHGRSDSTINRGGIRMGSSDITQIVDSVPGVAASMVIGAELGQGGYYMPLFVVPGEGAPGDEELRAEIIRKIRTDLSPRYVPDEVILAPDVPRTRTGKLMEVPIKRVVQGGSPESVNRAAAESVDVLDWYLGWASNVAREQGIHTSPYRR